MARLVCLSLMKTIIVLIAIAVIVDASCEKCKKVCKPPKEFTEIKSKSDLKDADEFLKSVLGEKIEIIFLKSYRVFNGPVIPDNGQSLFKHVEITIRDGIFLRKIYCECMKAFVGIAGPMFGSSCGCELSDCVSIA